ncbi:MAG: ribulose-phosphate 3-epimerase [Bryobacterales bacterium]|nr:ribulose-phosphate 3-epimerase [Bryobacteraceae bacterium]MDW8354420.1 ribulose-phosphate 3-epimerase [Bryobacterales bacterium]
MVEVVPSILSADFARLGEQIAAVEAAGARMLHVDVMDGHFVPNLTVGPPVVRSIRNVTRMILDVHFMLAEPERYIGPFVEAGADQISVHQETCPHLDRTLRLIQSEGARAGVVLNPATPVTMLEEVLELADFVLLMSVNPGFGAQQFIPRTLDKVRALDRRRRELGLRVPIEIDGGVHQHNIAEVVQAGVNWVVAGSAIFHSPDPGAAFSELQRLAREATAVRV